MGKDCRGRRYAGFWWSVKGLETDLGLQIGLPCLQVQKRVGRCGRGLFILIIIIGPLYFMGNLF